MLPSERETRVRIRTSSLHDHRLVANAGLITSVPPSLSANLGLPPTSRPDSTSTSAARRAF